MYKAGLELSVHNYFLEPIRFQRVGSFCKSFFFQEYLLLPSRLGLWVNALNHYVAAHSTHIEGVGRTDNHFRDYFIKQEIWSHQKELSISKLLSMVRILGS
jgi:hypothetical protein